MVFFQIKKRNRNYDNFGHAAFEGGGGRQVVVLVDLVEQTFQIFLKIFLEILVEVVDQAVEEIQAIEVQI